MSILVDTPFKVFFDANGAPLDGGYVYIGVAGLNPIANPLTVYWDAALTIPATNIRTSRGFLVYNGSPGNIYSSVNYSMLVKNAQGATVYSTLDSANALTDAKKIVGEYDIETMLIPGTTDKKIVFTNRQTGKQFTLTVTQAPDGALTEATHRLGCVANTIDWRFDFKLDNYDAGVMKGLFALQCFNADTESAMYWCMRHRPAGETDYGTLEDYYLMKLDETNGLQVNAALSKGTTPTWVKVLTASDNVAAPIDSSSVRHANGKVKTKIIELAFTAGNNTITVNPEITNVKTDKRIIGYHVVCNDFIIAGIDSLSSIDAMAQYFVNYIVLNSDTQITCYRHGTTGTNTIYLTLLYV